jgi:hypothetical protein
MLTRQIIRNLFDAATKAHQQYVFNVCAYPILLPFLAAGYIFVAFLLTFGIAGSIVMIFGLIPPPGGNSDAIAITAFLVLLPIAVVLSCHYLFLVLTSFVSTSSLDGSVNSIVRVLQLVATTAIYFAVVHYYVALFSGPDAYPGLTALAPREGWWNDGDWIAKLGFVPSSEMVVDCLYFSTITMATIGYGDIHPGNMIAKLATMAEVFTSFGLIVVILARVIGRPVGAPKDDQTSS